jgi:hypothetical protein
MKVLVENSCHFSFVSKSSHAATTAVAQNQTTTGGSNRLSLQKTCKLCHTVYPFYKNECIKCRYKFPKTRGGLSAGLLHTESYVL